MPRTPNHKKRELESSTAPTVETWLPGETLFSLVSRQHALSSNARCVDTCLHWFGHQRIGSAHDLPARIAHFTERTGGRFGSAASVIYKRTLLPYYLPFRSVHESTDAVAAMAGESIGALKARLGILATRFGAAHPLKACQRCIEQDESTRHVAYWHVEHQLPGVWICPWHHELLKVAAVKWMGIDRFGWCLPGDPSVALAHVLDVRQSPDLKILLRLANASVQLWSLPPIFHFSAERLFQLFREEMTRNGLCAESGRINVNSFGAAVFGITSAFDGIGEFDAMPQSPERAASTFSRLLSQPRSTPHPVRQLILILALFGDWDSFFKRYMEIPSNSAPAVGSCDDGHQSERIGDGSGRPDKRAEFFENLGSSNVSIRAAAERTGISVSTGMAWAAAANIEVKRRGKILTPVRRAQLVQALRRGISKADAANAFGVSIQTITTTLRTEVGLRDRWIRARFDRARDEARKVWKGTASKLSAPTAKALRSIHPAAFAWLYRHDRTWLKSFSSHISRAPKGNHSAVNWVQRDTLLAQKVNEAAIVWHEEHSKGHLTNAMLCLLVPHLKSRLSQLDQLPLTRATLAQISRWARL